MKIRERRSPEPAQGTRPFHASGIAPGFLSGAVTYGHVCLAGRSRPVPGCPRRSRSRPWLLVPDCPPGASPPCPGAVPAAAGTPRAPLPESARAAGSCSPAVSPPQWYETARPGTRNYTGGETRWRRLFAAVAKELVPRPRGVSAHGQPAVGDPPVAGARAALAGAGRAAIPERKRATRPAKNYNSRHPLQQGGPWGVAGAARSLPAPSACYANEQPGGRGDSAAPPQATPRLGGEGRARGRCRACAVEWRCRRPRNVLGAVEAARSARSRRTVPALRGAPAAAPGRRTRPGGAGGEHGPAEPPGQGHGSLRSSERHGRGAGSPRGAATARCRRPR